MKMYAIVNNQYLSDKQCGIQGIHAASELFVAYHQIPKSKAFNVYKEWAIRYKTVIMVKGGNCVTLNKTYTKLKKMADVLDLPIVKFKEDNTLGRAVTSIGIIMPTEESFDFLQITSSTFDIYEKLDAELSNFHLL